MTELNKGYWVLEYRHHYGTDIYLCETDHIARRTALRIFLGKWQEIKKTPELVVKMGQLCQRIIGGDLYGAMSDLIDICVDDKYNYDESFFWEYHTPEPFDDGTDLLDEAVSAKESIDKEPKKEGGGEG